MPEDQPSVVTELKTEPTPTFSMKPVNNMHQFNEKGFKYEGQSRSKLIIVAVIVILLLAVSAFLLMTETGRNLIGMGQKAAVTSSSSSSDIGLQPEPIPDSLPEAIDYEEFTSGNEVIDFSTAQLGQGLISINEASEFEMLDAELELGL